MLRKAIDESFMREQHGNIWQIAKTPKEAIKLLFETPNWDKDVRKFAAI
jgi:predicted Rossmann-fold nucleotide-binding protein